MSESRRLERDGQTAIRSTPLDKYLARPRDEYCSWYHFASNGYVPVVSGGYTHAAWPLNEDYCRTMLGLHWPNWFDIQEVKGDAARDDCPAFVKAQVAKARRYADHPQEPVFEDDEEDDAVEAEEQPDLVDLYAGQNRIYEGVEKDFDYDDGGEDHDWSSIRIILPEAEDPTKWLQESIKADDERETESADLDLPQVCPLSLNENQKSIESLVTIDGVCDNKRIETHHLLITSLHSQ